MDEGIDQGKPFRERTAFKGDLIVTGYFEDDKGVGYVAEAPLVIGNLATIRVVMKMRVSSDGKIWSAGCEITECTDVGDWD